VIHDTITRDRSLERRVTGKGFATELGLSLFTMVVMSLVLFSCLVAIYEIGFDEALKLLVGDLLSARYLGSFLRGALILAITGLAFSIPFQSGFYNVGGEGQLVIGAACAASIFFLFQSITAKGGLPLLLIVTLAGLVGATAGAVWALSALYLKLKFEVSEVVTTLLMNLIAFPLVAALLVSLGMADWSGGSQGLQSVALIPSQSHVEMAWGLSKAAPVLCLFLFLSHFYLWRTTPGLSLRSIGANQAVPALQGVPITRHLCVAVALGGWLAGLGGLDQLLVFGQFNLAYFAGLGFIGIAVGLLGRHRVIGILVAALFLSSWRVMSNILQTAGVAPEAVTVAEGVGVVGFLLILRRRQ